MGLSQSKTDEDGTYNLEIPTGLKYIKSFCKKEVIDTPSITNNRHIKSVNLSNFVQEKTADSRNSVCDIILSLLYYQLYNNGLRLIPSTEAYARGIEIKGYKTHTLEDYLMFIKNNGLMGNITFKDCGKFLSQDDFIKLFNKDHEVSIKCLKPTIDIIKHLLNSFKIPIIGVILSTEFFNNISFSQNVQLSALDNYESSSDVLGVIGYDDENEEFELIAKWGVFILFKVKYSQFNKFVKEAWEISYTLK